MCKDAMPEWIQDQAKGTGTDWDNPIQKYWHKSWFAYGPRSSNKWCKWREYPRTLFAIRSKFGFFRVEGEGWERDSSFAAGNYDRILFNRFLQVERNFLVENCILHKKDPGYLSAIQYWCKWHFQIQWPFFIAFHYKITDKYIFYFHFGARRDADKVYWFPSLFLGLTWK
jgi:hypothetical protein